MFTLGAIFWILMLVWLVFGGYRNRADIGSWATDSLLVWILLALLGWQVFGGLVK